MEKIGLSQPMRMMYARHIELCSASKGSRLHQKERLLEVIEPKSQVGFIQGGSDK